MRKLLVLSFLVSFLQVSLLAQVTKLPPVMSAEVAALGKFGTYEVNYNTGSPNISVPLYSLKSSFIPVNLQLSYDAKGFMPNESGYDVGKNWNLSAGGAITRIVNGEPDDKHNPNGGLSPETMLCYKKGFIYGLTSTGTVYSATHINNLSNYTGLQTWIPNSVTQCTYPVYNLPYEYEPDMFSFNFLGYSGRFFMAGDGSIKVISDRKFKVDVTQIGNRYNFQELMLDIFAQDVNCSALNGLAVSTIKLTADDGTEFTFGGALKDIEMSFSSNQTTIGPARGADPTSGVINAWYLTKVKNKDGNEILFVNDDFQEQSNGNRKDRTIINLLFEPNPSPSTNENAVTYSPFYELRFSFNKFTNSAYCTNGNGGSQNSPHTLSRSIVKKCYLKKIITDLEEIEFSYEKNQRFYTMDNPAFSLWEGSINLNKPMYTQRLDKIFVRDRKMNGVPVANYPPESLSPFARIISLNTVYKRNYLFLESVVNGSQRTEFIYDNILDVNNLPQPMTYGVDYMGFYNGKNGNNTFIGQMNLSTFEMEYPGIDRDPDPAFSTIGILKEIKYPTGGKSILDFENHSIGKKLERTTQSPITPSVTNYTGGGKMVPGLRIKKIQNIPGEIVEFKYVKNWETQSNLVSSGIMNYSNTTGYYFRKASNSSFYSSSIQENNLIHSSTYFEPAISYDEVVKVYPEGFEKFKFSSHLTNPDRVNPVSTSVFHTPEFSNTFFNNQMDKIYFRKSSLEIERGKLLASYTYDNSSTLKKAKEFQYNTNPQRFNHFNLSVNKPGITGICVEFGGNWGLGVLNVYENFYYHDLITKEIDTDYGSAGSGSPLISTTEYQYVDLVSPLLRKKITTTSKGEITEEEYKYAQDNPASQSAPVLASMLQKNMTGIVLESTTTIRGNTLLRKNIFTYNLVNNVPVLTKEETSNELKAPNQILPLLNINKYTAKGEIAESSLPNNISITYKWDYDGNFLVAKVNNAQDQDVRYTSFENSVTTPNALSDWQFNNSAKVNDYTSATGRSYYNLNNNPVNASNLNASLTYILSYWKKDDAGIVVTGGSFVVKNTKAGMNGWTLVQGQLSGTSTVQLSGNAKIDELRLYPANATIDTYTYEALLGLTSSCDNNSRISLYDYDQNSRLILIRDQHNNVIKKFCYNYAGQTEDCTSPCTYIIPDWQNTAAAPTCQQGVCGNTGYQLQQQMDMNPCSPTGGGYRLVEVYNPTACPMGTGSNITYNNIAGVSGFTATYTSRTTGLVYSFSVPSSGTGILGCIPADSYNLSISKSGNSMYLMFGTGCFTQSGTSGYFGKVNVPACSMVILDNDL